MRRDYFSCMFLLCICVSLFFVCFAPLYFTYNSIVVREFGLFERIMSVLFAVFVLLVVPIYSAYKKKFWIMAGLAFYGFFTLLPGMFLPGLVDKNGLINEIARFVWTFIYTMTRAPFAALSVAIGDAKARGLTNWILPVSLGCYALCQIFRYYRDAYVAEQLDPKTIMDTTAAENKKHVDPEAAKREAPKPEILGTVIISPNAPAASNATAPVVTPANAPAPAASKVSDETILMPANLKPQMSETKVMEPIILEGAKVYGELPLRATNSDGQNAIPMGAPDNSQSDNKLIINLDGHGATISEEPVKTEEPKLIINLKGTNNPNAEGNNNKM